MAANKLRDLIDNGKTIEVEKSKQKTRLLTFREASEELFEEWERKVAEGNLTQKTYEEYVIGLNVISRYFDRRLLTEIIRDDLLDYRRSVVEEHSNLTQIVSCS